MNIDIEDTITLNDKNEYVIISKAIFQNDTYYFIIDKNNNSNIKFCLGNSYDNSLIEIEDEKVVKELLPLFSKNVTKYLPDDFNY